MYLPSFKGQEAWVLYKVEMHCQHKRKPLTPLQLQQKANARVKSSRKVLMHDLRQKKTECPSCLKFTVVIPTKKDQHRALDHPYEDRKESIASIRSLVYAENAMQLVDRYNSLLRSGTAKKYPKFISYVSGHWSRRKEWAICFRKHLLVRGNHTNNYAEAGMKILKELIFNRVKA